MSLTKKQLIDALVNLEVPDDTIVVKTSGIGFEDVYDIEVQDIVSSSYKDNNTELAIILN
jgi:hypothetical protein